MRISQAFELYRANYMLIKKQSRRIMESHETCRRSLCQFLGDIDISELTTGDIGRWTRELEKTRCNNTIRNYLTRLRVVLDYCQLRDIPALKAALVPIPKRDATVPVFLTENEVEAMLEASYSIRNAFIISLLYSSGIRLSELIQLNRGQIAERRFTVIGKGKKPRLCFIDARTERLMDVYLRQRTDRNAALIVSNLHKDRMTATNVQLVISNTAKRAGISKHVTPHVLRHSFATNFLKNNGNMRYLSAMLGHASMDTTMMYAHVVDTDLQRQYEKYHTI